MGKMVIGGQSTQGREYFSMKTFSLLLCWGLAVFAGFAIGRSGVGRGDGGGRFADTIWIQKASNDILEELPPGAKLTSSEMRQKLIERLDTALRDYEILAYRGGFLFEKVR